MYEEITAPVSQQSYLGISTFLAVREGNKVILQTPSPAWDPIFLTSLNFQAHPEMPNLMPEW